MNSSKVSPAHAQSSRTATEGSLARSLRSLASAALAGAALLAASSSAFAGVPGLTVTVDSLAPLDPATNTRPISYSTGTVTYQTAYKVTMTASSPVSTVFFYAYTNVNNNLTAPFAPTVTDLRPGDTCTPVSPGTEMDCAIGAIAAGSTVTFTLLIPSPTAPDPVANSTLQVTWAVQAGQGQPNPSNLVHQGSQDVTLQVGTPKGGVNSYVLADAILGVQDGGSQTNVTPPIAVTVGVRQDITPSSCAAHLKTCFQSTITIVDQTGQVVVFPASDPLVIDLFRAASSLKKNARFANATLYYTGADNVTYQIPTCIGGQVPTTAPFRCVTPAVPAGTATPPVGATPGTTGVDALGNWLFHIIGSTNGIINW